MSRMECSSAPVAAQVEGILVCMGMAVSSAFLNFVPRGGEASPGSVTIARSGWSFLATAVK